MLEPCWRRQLRSGGNKLKVAIERLHAVIMLQEKEADADLACDQCATRPGDGKAQVGELVSESDSQRIGHVRQELKQRLAVDFLG